MSIFRREHDVQGQKDRAILLIVAGVARGTNGFDGLQEVASAYTTGDDLEKLSSAIRESVPRTLALLLNAVETTSGAVAVTTRTMSCPGDCLSPAVGYFLGAHEAVERRSGMDLPVPPGSPP